MSLFKGNLLKNFFKLLYNVYVFYIWVILNIFNVYTKILYLIFDYPHKYYTFKHFEA